MKIGIDARFYGPRVGGGGIGRYVSELITHLQEIDHENEYVLFLKKENFHECVITNPNFYKRMVDVHWYGIKEQQIMPKEIKLSGVDFMHYPHWNIPVFSRIPFIVTIHDLILLEQRRSARTTTKSSLVHGFKYAAFRTILEIAIHKSKHILTVSKYSKQSLLKHFKIKSKDITVIPNGVQPPIARPSVSLTPHGIYDPFFLYVGNAYPHKNLEVMVDAFSNIVIDNPYIQLVIAGRRDVFSKRLEEYAREKGISNEQIRFVDTPSDEMIAALYQEARAFIFPSRIEGFGIPPLEAMTHGTPVISSSASVMPEILGEAALFFDPDDTEKLEELMRLIITEPASVAHLKNLGFEQVDQYKWHDVAEKTLEAYKIYGKNLDKL